jgi:hypothetical protein
MRFMVIVKSNKESEAGVKPSERLLTAMGRFNDELIKAGVMLSGEGLHPSSKGKRIRYAKGGGVSVTDGPFAETKELIGGFWIWQLPSMAEAVAWAKRIPNPDDQDFEFEIRQVFDATDFGAEYTPELREQEERQRAELERQAKGAKR